MERRTIIERSTGDAISWRHEPLYAFLTLLRNHPSRTWPVLGAISLLAFGPRYLRLGEERRKWEPCLGRPLRECRIPGEYARGRIHPLDDGAYFYSVPLPDWPFGTSRFLVQITVRDGDVQRVRVERFYDFAI